MRAAAEGKSPAAAPWGAWANSKAEKARGLVSWPWPHSGAVLPERDLREIIRLNNTGFVHTVPAKSIPDGLSLEYKRDYGCARGPV
jgi:hypothetical protein